MVKVVTFGCRLNAYESEIMKDLGEKANLDQNTVIVNTCAVTAEAERQGRQSIRKMKRENPNANIIVTGCAAQIDPEKYASMPEVESVLGNHDKLQLKNFENKERPKIVVSDIMTVQETAPHLVSHFEGKSRAFVQIQNGCDHRCTFCDIPYGRGNSRSVPIGHITEEVSLLVQKGFNEIVLTGVDITSYGGDLPGNPTLGQMMKRLLAAVPGIERLRLSSLDPSEIDDALFALIENEPRLMPHLHISMQAGSDLILKRMKRRHLQKDLYDFTQKVRKLRPDVVFGADIIVGFPTETDDHFNDTLRVVEDCDISLLHVFPYSPRPLTPAARMPQVDGKTAKARAKTLRDTGEAVLKRTSESFIGKDVTLLMEKEDLGRSEHYLNVKIDTQEIVGSTIKCHITHLEDGYLRGTKI